MEIDFIYFVYFSGCSWSWWISHPHSYQLSWQEEQSNQCQLCIQPAVSCNLFLQLQTAQGSKERLYVLLQQQGNSTEPQRLATTERVMFTDLYISVNEGKRKFHQIFLFNMETPYLPYTLLNLQQQPLTDPNLAAAHKEEALMAFFHHLDTLTLPWGHIQ